MLGVACAVNGILRGELAGILPEPGSQAYRQGAKGKDLNAMDRGADLFVLFLYFLIPSRCTRSFLSLHLVNN